MKFGIAAIAGDGKHKRFFVQRTFKGDTITQKDSDFSSTSFNYDLHATAQGSAGTETWVFTIFDNNGGSAAVTLMITTTLLLPDLSIPIPQKCSVLKPAQAEVHLLLPTVTFIHWLMTRSIAH